MYMTYVHEICKIYYVHDIGTCPYLWYPIVRLTMSIHPIHPVSPIINNISSIQTETYAIH